MLNSEQRELIKDLKDEAHDVKKCAVQYFVRITIFVSAFLGVVVSLMSFTMYASFAGILVLPVLFASTKILLHKYGTANRNLGYQLHLERSLSFKELYNSKSSWESEYGNIGWEEAMRAWRIVQATVFEEICEKKHNNYTAKADKISYAWFDVHRLIDRKDPEEGASYYASSFLKHMVTVVIVLLFAALIPIAIFMGDSIYKTSYMEAAAALSMLVVSGLYIQRIIKFTIGRRYQLESGILSISSCAVIWHAVVLAHYRALDTRKKLKAIINRTRKEGYAYNVSIQARRLADNIGDIHGWIEGKWLRKTERSSYAKPRVIHVMEPKENIIEMVNHSSTGFGGVVSSSFSLVEGDKLIFREDDVIPGKIEYVKSPDGNGFSRIGVSFV